MSATNSPWLERVIPHTVATAIPTDQRGERNVLGGNAWQGPTGNHETGLRGDASHGDE